MRLPVLDYAPSVDVPKPIALKAGAPKKWCFSFRFWQEARYFSLAGVDDGWTTSLLARLQALSAEDIEDFLCSGQKRDSLRYHRINWDQKNIPVGIKDLDWVPSTYRDNQEDYPLVQFSVSTSLGRVVGFWDENDVFNVVLLDPHHNMQPCESTGHRVTDCAPRKCDYTNLIISLDTVVKDCCQKNECSCDGLLSRVKTRRDILHDLHVVMVKVPEQDMLDVHFLKENGHAGSFYEIFKRGLESTVEGYLESQTS